MCTELISINVDVSYLSKGQEFLFRLKKFVIFQSPLQLEAMSKKDHSIDMEGAQQAIQLVTTITD